MFILITCSLMFKRRWKLFWNLLKEHHTYQKVWKLLKETIIQDEYCNKLQTQLAIRRGHVAGYLKKGTSRKFAKAIFYFLKCDENNRCWVEVNGKRWNLGDRERMQAPCLLHFGWRKVYVDRLKRFSAKLWKCTPKVLTK